MMTGRDVDGFVERLKDLMGQVPDVERSDMLIHTGKMDARMRSNGYERPPWKGPISELEILGKDVVVPSAMGKQVGRVVYFGIHQEGAVFERSVYAMVPSSGTLIEAPGSAVELPGSADLDRMRREIDMAGALERAESKPKEPSNRRRKHEKDPAFTQHLVDLAIEIGLTVEKKKTFNKIYGSQKGRTVYVAVEALRVDLSGFCVEHSGIRAISADEAKEQHLGAVRGTIIFDDREVAEEAFVESLEALI